MAQIITHKFVRGLDITTNPYVASPGKDGYSFGARNSCVIADNTVLTRQRMLCNRKGFDYFTQGTSAPVDKFIEFQQHLIEHQQDATMWCSDPETGVRTQYTGSYTPPTGYAMDATVSRSSLYFTTSRGVMKLDSTSGQPVRSGMPKGLDVRCTAVAATGGFLANNSKVAYHVTWLRTDANKAQIRGDVSTATICTNTTGGAANVQISFTVPWDVTTSDKYEIWRTVSKDATYSDPGDECYLISAIINTNAPGTTITFTDSSPDTIITAANPLYTNADQEGALQGNSRPPYAICMDKFYDYTLFGNTAIDYQLNQNLLGVVQLTAGVSTLVINSTSGIRTYTFNTAENVATQQVQLFTGGTSNAYNIEQTTRSLCHVINGDPSGLYYAEYSSGPNDNPGLFRVWARSPTSGMFWLTANSTTTGNEFSPPIPTTGQSVSADNDYRQNRLFYSKLQEPDAVPILNTIDVGRLDEPIYRIVSCRDACYIIKQDGVFYLSGTDAPFTLVQLDGTCHCIAPQTAVMLNNQVFMLSNQGVVQISVSGVTVISFDIELAIQDVALYLSNVKTLAFGVANESMRHYHLWLPQSVNDSSCPICYVYHTFIQEWTCWLKPSYAGLAMDMNWRVYVSSGLEHAVLRQRHIGDLSDYSDEPVPITITAFNDPQVSYTWSSTVFQPTVGMSLHQGVEFAKIIAVTSTTFTLDRNGTAFTTGAATVRMPIASHVRLSPQVCGESGLVKQLYTASFLLVDENVSMAQIEVATNESAQMWTFPLSRSLLGQGWGTNQWGNGAWGDVVSPIKAVPWLVDVPVPDNTGEFIQAGWLHCMSQEKYCLAQASFAYDPLAEVEFVA